MPTAATVTNSAEMAHDSWSAQTRWGALVLGADYRGLGVVRSLGRRGLPVWVVKQGGHLVATTSRYVQRRVPWPTGDDGQKIAFLLDLRVRHGLDGWMLFPTDDYTVALISRHHEILASGYRLTVSPWESLRWACDKRLLHDAVRRLGLPHPWTAVPRTREELTALDCPFPVILKPAIRLQPNSLATPKAWLAENRESLLARYDEATSVIPAEHLLVQEVVPGGGETQFSYAALCRDGSSLASVVARRTRQFPRDFGQFSTYVETVDEPHVVELANRLLAASGFTGLVEVEFKRDPRSGRLNVLDVNPRVWGWHTLSRRVGIDFPYLLSLLVRGEPVPARRSHPGERWMHMSADMRVAIPDIVTGRLPFRAYVRSLHGPVESAVFAWDDPVPGFLDLPLFACTIGRSLLFGAKP